MGSLYEKIKYLFLQIAVLVFIFVMAVNFNYADYDLWARLAAGSIFDQTGSVAVHDIFAYTAVKPLWIDHEWGSGVIFYYLSGFLGDYGLCLLKFFILFSIFIFIYHSNQLRLDKYNIEIPRHKDPARLSFYILVLIALLPSFHSIIRSHSFTYLFFALWLYLLELVRNGNKKMIWLFPVTMILWANLHGGFLAGLGIVFLYMFGEFIQRRQWKPYALIFVLSSLVTLINPYGFNYWEYMCNAVLMPRPYITEWMPLNLFGTIQAFIGFKVLIVGVLTSLMFLLFSRKERTFEIDLTEVIVLAVTLFLAIKHIRHMPFFVIASASYMYYLFYPALHWASGGVLERFYSFFSQKVIKTGAILRHVLVYALILLLLFLYKSMYSLKVEVSESIFPTRAVEFIDKNELSGNLLVSFDWGSYALWKLYPKCLVAVDGRYEEVYENQVIEDIASFTYLRSNWQDILKKYHTDIILIPIVNKNLYSRLLKLEPWRLVYKDDYAAVFLLKEKKIKEFKNPDCFFDPNKGKYESRINLLNNEGKI